MRVFSFIFIVNLVLLLAQPCKELAADIGTSIKANATTNCINKQADLDLLADDCSPLCICSCCSLTVAGRSVNLAVNMIVEDNAASRLAGNYSMPPASTFQTSIWQPPKA